MNFRRCISLRDAIIVVPFSISQCNFPNESHSFKLIQGWSAPTDESDVRVSIFVSMACSKFVCGNTAEISRSSRWLMAPRCTELLIALTTRSFDFSIGPLMGILPPEDEIRARLRWELVLQIHQISARRNPSSTPWQEKTSPASVRWTYRKLRIVFLLFLYSLQSSRGDFPCWLRARPRRRPRRRYLLTVGHRLCLCSSLHQVSLQSIEAASEAENAECRP